MEAGFDYARADVIKAKKVKKERKKHKSKIEQGLCSKLKKTKKTHCNVRSLTVSWTQRPQKWGWALSTLLKQVGKFQYD